ncbi:hypothetical protein G4B88_020560 [Cannabis sativa]|uniref:MD-2-related lipid-recognition domain-containing protein n=1 Tax=Cannabis sativa TaxID=3483 RepID=A0A7J6FU41_CANSA|nr:hypothetical protein G4B88_020560 [Cannabis sativa]
MASLFRLKNFNLTFVVLCPTLLLILHPITATDVKHCDNKIDYAIKVHGVEISPDPVIILYQPQQVKTIDQMLRFSLCFVFYILYLLKACQDIPGGKVVIKVSYFGLQVHTETHNLCEEISCPIAAGNFVLSHSQTLPGFAPPGSYTLKMTVEDKNQLLTCIKFNFKISLFPVSDN